MSGSIGTLTARLGIDAREFQSGLQGAKKDVDGFSTGTKLAFGALGVAAATGFGLVAKGALQAQSAQGEYMRLTGKTREEAKKFVSSMDSLAGSAGTVGMRFEDLTTLGATVEQQFGTSGDKTRDLTEYIAEFAKVTKQDATQAAGDLEDTLSAYGLTADDAAGFTDKLVAASQKYGTQVGPQQLSILRAMSPALQAMGQDIDDGIGLLNIFEVAGLDASAAQRGFNSALDKLPPGTNLDDLVAHFSDLKEQGIDPTAEAIDLFGTKAGPALAKAIQPGMDSLSDLGVTAEESGGRVHQTANDMLTDTEKIRGFFDKILAGAREVGQEMGPALAGLGGIATVFASLPSKLTKPLTGAMSGMLSAVAGSTPVRAASAAIGVVIAEAMQLAATGAQAVKTFGLRIAAMSIPLAGSGTTVGTAVGAAISGGILLGLATIGAAALIAGMAQGEEIAKNNITNEARVWGKEAVAQPMLQGVSDEIKAHYQKVVDDASYTALHSRMPPAAAHEAGLRAGQRYLDSVGITISSGSGQIADSMAQMVSHISSERAENAFVQFGVTAAEAANDGWKQGMTDAANRNRVSLSWWQRYLNFHDAQQAAHDAAKEAANEFALGWEDGVPSIHQQWKAFLKDMESGLDPTKEMAWLHGKLTSQKLAEGLASNDPIVRAKAEHERDMLQAEWDGLYNLGYRYGKDGGKGIADGIRDTTAAAADKARALMFAVNAELHKIITGIRINVDTSTGEQYGHGHGYAAGGYMPPGTVNTVGESGIERVTMFPGGGAFVTPLGNTHSQPSVGPVNIAIYDARDPDAVASKVRTVLHDLFNGQPSVDRSWRPSY